MDTTPSPGAPAAQPGTGRIAVPGTSRFRRTVTGAISRTAAAPPVQVTCKACGKAFMAAQRKATVQLPCVHCGCIQTVD